VGRLGTALVEFFAWMRMRKDELTAEGSELRNGLCVASTWGKSRCVML